MKKLLLLVFAIALASADPALAANCPANPYTLTNGATADATQVMANFNNVLGCANTSLAHNGANSDITSFSNPIGFASSVTLTQTTVAALPACNAGAKGVIYSVSDANAPTWNGTLTGGGTSSVLALCDGTNWRAH